MLTSMKLCVFVFGQHYVLRLSADQWFGCWKLCLQSNIVRKRFSLFKKRNVKNLSVSEKKAPGLPVFLPVLLFQVGLCGIDLFSLAYVRARAAQEGGSSQLCRHTVVFICKLHWMQEAHKDLWPPLLFSVRVKVMCRKSRTKLKKSLQSCSKETNLMELEMV